MDFNGSLGDALWWHALFGVCLYVIWRLPLPRAGKERQAATRERGPGTATGPVDARGN